MSLTAESLVSGGTSRSINLGKGSDISATTCGSPFNFNEKLAPEWHGVR